MIMHVGEFGFDLSLVVLQLVRQRSLPHDELGFLVDGIIASGSIVRFDARSIDVQSG